MLTLSAWLAGCGPDDGKSPHTGLEGSCAGSSTTQFATEVGTHTELEGCGDSFLGELEILGEGAFDLALYTDGERLIPSVTSRDGGVFAGLRARGTFVLEGSEPLLLWRLPFSGSGSAGVAPLGAPELDAEGWPTLPGGPEDPHDTSSWAGHVARADGGALLVGSLSGAVTRATVAFSDDGSSWFVWGGRGEGTRVAAGQSLFLDPLHVAIGADPQALWADWADRALAGSRGVAPAAGPTVGVSTEDLDPSAVRMEDALAAVPEPGSWVLLGQGWETTAGDGIPNARFPEGLAPLPAAARAAGAHAAVTLAPFALDPDGSVLAAHPEWAVGGSASGGLAALDTTRPEALAWLVGSVTTRVDEGFEAVELASAAAGAVEGTRATPVSGVAAWRAALQAVRTAIGPDVRLLVADAPLLPSVGLVDGFRLGAGEAWPDDADRRSALARDRAGLAFTNGRWWWSDPGLVSTGDALAAALGSGGGLRIGSGAPELLRADVAELTGVSVLPADWSLPPTVLEAEGFTVLQAPGGAPVTAVGPGGVEVLTGEVAAPGERALEPGAAEIWVP